MRLEILNTVAEELRKIRVANGFLTNPALVTYNDGSPAQYEDKRARIEITYRITDFAPKTTNRSWEWEGVLEVVAYIYNDRTPTTECNVQRDILRALGANQSLSGPLRFLTTQTGMEPAESDGEIAGVSIQRLVQRFSVRWVTPMWDS